MTTSTTARMVGTYDAVIVGSGINALVAGARLAGAGWRVAICELSDRLGGAIFTSEDTFPGYVVELMSSWHPLFVGGPAFAALGDELARRCVVYRMGPRGLLATGAELLEPARPWLERPHPGWTGG